jgi:opacity protein-like surface antigen
MPLARSLYLLPLALAGFALAAQEAPSKPEDKAPVAEHPKEEDDCHVRFRFHHRPSVFGAYVQADAPLRDLKESLDRRTGLGVGVQWTRDHGDWNASRTRLEWNTFPEGGAVGAAGTRTYAKNVILSFDHLLKLNQGTSQAYLVAGLGGARWDLEQTTAGQRTSLWTTKLAFTAGAGVQLGRRVNLEARYVVSSVGSTFDANSLQASLGWRF